MNDPGLTTPRLELVDYTQGVVSGDRSVVARAITLLESTRADHRDLAAQMLTQLQPLAGGASRIGITGVPGAGKSTFIGAFGSRLTADGHRVAVLAVDPSSRRTGGSILGDKTRMPLLSSDPNAFVRPSPSAGTLGGVARATREAMIVMEAAGYDVVIVETVGVGQSEAEVAAMVDTFLLLVLSRAGDQLQGIKKGVLELADVIAVNKADGDHVMAAKSTARELAGALHLVQPRRTSWTTPVLTCSGLEGTGLDEVWTAIERHRATLVASGELAQLRASQQLEWMWAMVRDGLLHRLMSDPAVQALQTSLERGVHDGTISAVQAAEEILHAFLD